jgi:hypothetical protein
MHQAPNGWDSTRVGSAEEEEWGIADLRFLDRVLSTAWRQCINIRRQQQAKDDLMVQRRGDEGGTIEGGHDPFPQGHLAVPIDSGQECLPELLEIQPANVANTPVDTPHPWQQWIGEVGERPMPNLLRLPAIQVRDLLNFTFAAVDSVTHMSPIILLVYRSY